MTDTTLPDEATAAVLARVDAGQTVTIAEIGGLFAADRDAFGTTTLGLRWDTLHRDRVTAHLDVGPTHQQPYGIVHGGVWCSVIESLASIGAALRVASSGRYAVGVSNSTDFLRAHRVGRIDAVATPIHAGRLQQLWVAELTRPEDGKVVARGQVRLQVIDPSQLGDGS